MTKPQPKPTGTEVEIREGGTVIRPDGSEITVTGGIYVLDAPGEHVVDGKAIDVRLRDLADDPQPSASA